MAHSGTIIHMRNVPGNAKLRALDLPLPCLKPDGTKGLIPHDFIWNGASSGVFKWFFPRHDHPIATCRHDYRCGKAKNKAERRFADDQFKIDVGTTGTKWETFKGYCGVRIGAFFGIGSAF